MKKTIFLIIILIIAASGLAWVMNLKKEDVKHETNPYTGQKSVTGAGAPSDSHASGEGFILQSSQKIYDLGLTVKEYQALQEEFSKANKDFRAGSIINDTEKFDADQKTFQFDVMVTKNKKQKIHVTLKRPEYNLLDIKLANDSKTFEYENNSVKINKRL